MNSLKYALAAISFALLTACGGGGGGGTGSTADNPLKKYEGTYYVCDRNEKSIFTFNAINSISLNMTTTTVVYSDTNCIGSVLGTYTIETPMVVAYEGQTTATLPPITLVPYADVVDKVSLNVSASKGVLTGTGVEGACVKYSYVDGNVTTNGNSCFELVIDASKSYGALYLTLNGNYLVFLALENNVYTPGPIVSRDPLFNTKSILPD